MTKGAIAAVAVALALTAGLAEAKTHTLARAGIWEAFGGTTSKDEPICGMSSEVDTHYFGIKRIGNSDTVIIQVGTGQWKVTDGQKMKVLMNFDSHPTWTAAATGMHFDDGDAGLEYSVNKKELSQFMLEFRGSGRLRVQFPEANFADWSLNLNGSSAVGEAFDKCVSQMP